MYSGDPPEAEAVVMRYAISEIPFVKRLLRSRWPQWILTVLLLAGFVLAIIAGLFGTPAGNRNFGIVFVWIVWWALLILLLVPFAGRLWCSVCPIPAPGEWLQRRALVRPRPGGKLHTLGKKWARALRNIWLQNFGFLGVALFSTVILTTPRATAAVLLAFVLVAIATSLLCERRTFCRYLCPVGGFIGLYSQAAAIELRVKDPAICAGHKEKTCYTGSDAGYGCPWLLFPGGLTNSTYCGLCTECLKTCDRDNIAIFLRRPGTDLLQATGRKLDEAYKGLIMLACAFIYSAVLIGPWGTLKEVAAAVGSPGWFGYAAVFLALNLAVFPGLFWLAVRAGAGGQADRPSSRLFADYAVVLVPLGLAAWAAFSLSFVLINLSYAWPALSDPLGWGWNLFGTADLPWTPYAAGLVPYLQTPVLLIGLVAAIGLALRTARQHGQPLRAALPVVLFCVAATLGLLGLYLG
ncbi:MAG: 4Fe-4S binding protein [Anaerolineae bacterium]|nr:4Fe-4S binding protein [Anaerolineae bacterium]